jgi:hypothetical protein
MQMSPMQALLRIFIPTPCQRLANALPTSCQHLVTMREHRSIATDHLDPSRLTQHRTCRNPLTRYSGLDRLRNE